MPFLHNREPRFEDGALSVSTNDPPDLPASERIWKIRHTEILKDASNTFNDFETCAAHLRQKLEHLKLSTESIADLARVYRSSLNLLESFDTLFTCFHDNLIYLLNVEPQANASCSCSHLLGDCDRTKWKKLHQKGDRDRALKTLASHISSDPFTSLKEALKEFWVSMGQDTSYRASGPLGIVVPQFVHELERRAQTLQHFDATGQLQGPAMLFAINDLCPILKQHYNALVEAVAVFIDHDIAVVRELQQQSGEEFQNLSTVSTLLSAVTATTIQYNLGANPEAHNIYHSNVLWIISLIFSTGSAIQSQLAFYWLRHPRHQYSPSTLGFYAWTIRSFPIILFAVSIIAFSGGLISYSYAAFGHTSLPSIAVACTAVTLSMLCYSSFWRFTDGFNWAMGEPSFYKAVLRLREKISAMKAGWRRKKDRIKDALPGVTVAPPVPDDPYDTEVHDSPSRLQSPNDLEKGAPEPFSSEVPTPIVREVAEISEQKPPEYLQQFSLARYPEPHMLEIRNDEHLPSTTDVHVPSGTSDAVEVQELSVDLEVDLLEFSPDGTFLAFCGGWSDIHISHLFWRQTAGEVACDISPPFRLPTTMLKVRGFSWGPIEHGMLWSPEMVSWDDDSVTLWAVYRKGGYRQIFDHLVEGVVSASISYRVNFDEVVVWTTTHILILSVAPSGSGSEIDFCIPLSALGPTLQTGVETLSLRGTALLRQENEEVRIALVFHADRPLEKKAVGHRHNLGPPESRLLIVDPGSDSRKASVERQFTFVHPIKRIIASRLTSSLLITFTTSAQPRLIPSDREMGLFEWVHAFVPKPSTGGFTNAVLGTMTLLHDRETKEPSDFVNNGQLANKSDEGQNQDIGFGAGPGDVVSVHRPEGYPREVVIGADQENTLRIWNGEDKSVIRKTIIPDQTHEGQQRVDLHGERVKRAHRTAQVAWNPAPSSDGRTFVATADRDRKIRLWAISNRPRKIGGAAQNVKEPEKASRSPAVVVRGLAD